MKRRRVSARNGCMSCAFGGECEFRNIVVKKISQTMVESTTCSWKGHCNQQVDRRYAFMKHEPNNAHHSFFSDLRYIGETTGRTFK